MILNDITAQIIDAAIMIHKELGQGLLESVYEISLAYELRERGLNVTRQVPIAIEYNGIKFDEGFRADLIVNDSVILELKSVLELAPVHKKQLLTYLRLTDTSVGLLLNFGSSLMKNGIHRIVNNYQA